MRGRLFSTWAVYRGRQRVGTLRATTTRAIALRVARLLFGAGVRVRPIA